MNNPFESIDARLSNIENLLIDIKHQPKENASDQNDVLTIKEAAKLLNLSVTTIYSYVHEREIPFSKIKKRLYFSKKDLTEWIKTTGRKKTISEINSSAHESIKIKGK